MSNNMEERDIALLGFCRAEHSDSVKEFDALQVIETKEEDIIGIATKNIDVNDSLDMLSTTHSNLIELVKKIDLIPVKIGTIIKKQDLQNDLEDVDSRLSKFEDHVESIIRADYDENQVLENILQDLKEDGKADNVDKVQLGKDVYDALKKKAEDDQKKIISELEELSSIEIIQRKTDDFRVCDLSVLSVRESVDKIEKVLRKIADDEVDTIKFTLVSPMPIYNFIK